MKMTLKASLSSSTKEIDIYYGDPLLYIRPKEGSYRFPELYTTDGCEIVISELFLDYVSDKIVDSIEEGAKQQIKNIALLKLEKGKMVTNTGKVYTGLNSTCKCNRILINNLFKFFVWREVSKSFTRSIIEFIFNPLNLFVGYFTKVLTLWDILPDKPVGVFIGTTFP